MTVVLDTNVLVAALVAEGLCREVVHRVIRMRGVVTGDDDLLVLGRYSGIDIVSPRRLLEILDSVISNG